jgi:hypothetical protein
LNNNVEEISNTDLQESQSESNKDKILSLSKKTFELEEKYKKDKYKARIESVKNQDPNLPEIFKYDIEELLPFYYCVLDIDKEPYETEKMLKDKNILLIYAEKCLYPNDQYDFKKSVKFYTWVLDEFKDCDNLIGIGCPDNKCIHKQRIKLLYKHGMFNECTYDLEKFIHQYSSDYWTDDMLERLLK